eukprot:m.171994 g.171994  ORF g.171994 m.171994 type:complete len:280 (+) comp21275_c0_seq3:3680-4519(+)
MEDSRRSSSYVSMLRLDTCARNLVSAAVVRLPTGLLPELPRSRSHSPSRPPPPLGLTRPPRLPPVMDRPLLVPPAAAAAAAAPTADPKDKDSDEENDTDEDADSMEVEEEEKEDEEEEEDDDQTTVISNWREAFAEAAEDLAQNSLPNSNFFVSSLNGAKHHPRKKNRLGQRARQQLAEKKYGQQARHVVDPSLDRSKPLTSNTGPQKDKRSSAVRDGKQKSSQPRQLQKAQGKLQGKSPLSAQDEALHPSWVAKRLLKEKEAAPVKFEGKKITFDDDD